MVAEDTAQAKLCSGAFNLRTPLQNKRLSAIRKALREHRELFMTSLAQDVNERVDDGKNPYWASEQHLTECLLCSLEALIAAKMPKKSKAEVGKCTR